MSICAQRAGLALEMLEGRPREVHRGPRLVDGRGAGDREADLHDDNNALKASWSHPLLASGEGRSPRSRPGIASTRPPASAISTRSASVADLANRTAHHLGADLHIDPADVVNLSYGGEAYGVPSQAGLSALHLLARTEGIFLDPVYTSKGVSGLIDQIQQGVVGPEDTVIYIHTGGLPLNFAYANELAEAFDLSLESDILLGLDD